jgi:hypothetical protein
MRRSEGFAGSVGRNCLLFALNVITKISQEINLSFVLHDSGDFAMAQGFAEEAIELSMKNNDRFCEGLSRISMGRILGKRDASSVVEAEKYILKGIVPLNS